MIKKARKPAADEAQILSYRHGDKRKNNPEVGMVTPATDPEVPKTTWAYDPHLDPTLQWTGKAERLSFEVDTVSLHVHERIDPASILSAVLKSQPSPSGRGAGGEGKKGSKGAQKAQQPGLFDAPFENLPLRDAIDFYKHEKGWSNRMVAGDSLLVMNSLLQKEGMAGQLQMMYFDPPYGIKYGSNFQPFVNKRDVKDRADADLTQEPEMIKAFRDTWELGIHSYLSYLRDRLLLAKELLNESGSVFVQISDENLHHVREIMDEIFGSKNFVSQISYSTTTGTADGLLGNEHDKILWYGKERKSIKYRQLWLDKGVAEVKSYKYKVRDDGVTYLGLSKEERAGKNVGDDWRIAQFSFCVSQDPGDSDERLYVFRDSEFDCGASRHWKTTNPMGLHRLAKSGRLIGLATQLNYIRFLDDYPLSALTNVWNDTGSAGYSSQDPKRYVVQTDTSIVERCLLMTTDPGDLVFDPTCGSGTTAFVAEKWGRRWITCDTSRVAVTLAKQRLMTASFDYYELAYPHEGLRGGFMYKTVPHVMLKSIANNPEVDEIYERMHPAIEAALAALNRAVGKTVRPEPVEGQARALRPGSGQASTGSARTEGVGSGRTEGLQEWEVPFDFPAEWNEKARVPFEVFHTARQAMQKQMDRSIADHADQETLYDQPQKSKTKLRITGPFSLEAVPFPTVLALETDDPSPQPLSQGERGTQWEADVTIARSGESSRQHQWRDELLKTGIRGKGGQMLKFAELETQPGTRYLHATGHLETGERVVISFGPEYAALEQRQVALALTEAGELFPLPKMIVFCAFTFDPEAAKDIDHMKGITALKAQMNTDLLTDDLKKARSSNQSFWLMGQPDVEVRKRKDGSFEVEVHGFDYFDTVKGELVSGGKSRIAMWSLDTDYDERSLFPHQVFFPMAGKGEGWDKLKKDIRAELDEELLEQFHGTVSLPFAAGENQKVAVKIVDDRGIESLKIVNLEG